ncbi:hypothetical protein ECEPECA12_5413 [Escherichia coli EPECa12]|nr:hypothetical protein ECEPECA12_5413 [Escherichia coli EPECa12]EMW67642.1 hypothetical protein EC2756500_5233 [Escherichia coli 2756500]
MNHAGIASQRQLKRIFFMLSEAKKTGTGAGKQKFRGMSAIWQ